jgi:PIN domain nuclease of toxin-antitoxin system
VNGLLLDTHVWLWYLAGAAELPPGLRRVIDETTGDCWLSPVSIWETALLVERGRIRINLTTREWVARARERLVLNEAPLNAEIALVSREIRLPHQDPADRFLAATAIVHGLSLATVDRRLLRARAVPTRSH